MLGNIFHGKDLHVGTGLKETEVWQIMKLLILTELITRFMQEDVGLIIVHHLHQAEDADMLVLRVLGDVVEEPYTLEVHAMEQDLLVVVDHVNN